VSGTTPGTGATEEPSQLGTLRRLRLYIRNPRDAFSIVSRTEQRSDALLVLALYFVVRAPVVIQRSVALGQLDRLGAATWAGAVVAGVAGGVILGIVSLAVCCVLAHLVVNVALGAGRTFGTAARVTLLSLAPQLILVVEFPSLLLDFRGQPTFLAFLLLRLAAGVLSLRTFYWGLRTAFGLRRPSALVVTLVPAALVIGLVLATLGPGPR